MIPEEYDYVLCPGVYPESDDILPDAHYFFLRRLNGLLIHCLIGRIDDGRKLIYVDLETGIAMRYQINMGLRCWQKTEERSYSVPLKVRETSIISEMALTDYFEHFYGC